MLGSAQTQTQAGRKLPRVDELDGLRGILASWVAVSHILCWCGFAKVALPYPLGPLWPDFILAQPAVETFIILSGFAISFMLHARKESYGAFMRGRFFRIYPTYLLCLLLGLATIHLIPVIVRDAPWRDTPYFYLVRSTSESERAHPILHTLCHLTLLNGLVPRSVLFNATGTLLPPAWSITLEWQYYLLAPFLARAVRSGAWLVVLSVVSYLGIQFSGHWQNPHSSFLPAQLPLFLVGIGSFHLYAHFSNTAAGRSAKFSVPVAALLAGAILLSWHSIALAAWGLAFGCVFVEGPGLFGRALCALRRFLLHPWLQRLGKISYPLYLVHWPIIIAWMFLLLRWKPAATPAEAAVWMFLFAAPTILLAAVLLHKFVETPAMKLGKGFKAQGMESAGEKLA